VAEVIVVVDVSWLVSQVEGGVDVVGGSEGEWVVAGGGGWAAGWSPIWAQVALSE
jgi:hypothetical protein